MKSTSTILMILLLASSACVQKSYKKTVVFRLAVPNRVDIKAVGLRGEEKPLSWRRDTAMKRVIKDSLYEATITFITGYKFTQVKFALNNEFELKDKDNRQIVFAEEDTTFYNAIFDKEQ